MDPVSARPAEQSITASFLIITLARTAYDVARNVCHLPHATPDIERMASLA